MLGYADMSTKSQSKRLPGVWLLLLSLLLFTLALTLIALLIQEDRVPSPEEQRNGDLYIVSRLWSHFRPVALNETHDEVTATVERIARDATNATRKSNNYYEEQRAVVVNAESAEPIMAARQDAFGPPQSRSDSYEEEPVYDYGGQQSPEEQYTDDQAADSNGEGRAAPGQPFDSYYGQWQYGNKATPPPAPPSNNRKLQPASNRPPYPAYEDVYDYPMGFQPRPQAHAMSKQAVSTPVNANGIAPAPIPTESTLVTILKSLKQIWDLYQALTSAWSTVSERHQQSNEQLKKERLEKQRLRQQQQQQKLRGNSKKPPRIEGEKFAQRNQTKKAKGTSTTTTTRTSTSNLDDAEEEVTAAPIKVASKGDTAQKDSERGLRQKREPESEPGTDVGEGRYIKGDPLKGYYDFVITEGSYKFWAAFQVGTAILIIYSTFAAIYYSKVNPLTSDYDYQDYLGAGRSLSGGDDDFVDDAASDAATLATTSSTSRLMDWLPRTAHSLQFILDAIDQIPLDHDQKQEKGWLTGKTDPTLSSDQTTGAKS